MTGKELYKKYKDLVSPDGNRIVGYDRERPLILLETGVNKGWGRGILLDSDCIRKLSTLKKNCNYWYVNGLKMEKFTGGDYD